MPSPNESQACSKSQNKKQNSTKQTPNIMNTTTTSSSEEFAALIGLDWASERHALCLYDCATAQRESSTLEHTPEAIAQWANALQERFAGKKTALLAGPALTDKTRRAGLGTAIAASSATTVITTMSYLMPLVEP